MLQLRDKVSETLLIPLYMRYLASQQPNPIIRDEAALALVPQIDYDFAKFDTAVGSLAGTAVRARYFDDVARGFISRHDNPVIVQLGCGLDDRLGRLGEAAAERPFVQLDLPEVIALRREWLPPKPNETLLAASAFDPAWAEGLKAQFPDAQFLFLMEGVLMYFPRETVRGLFATLAQFHGSEAAFDVCSSLVVKKQHRHDTLGKLRARFEYGCDNPREMEQWADHLTLVSEKHYPDFVGFKRAGRLYWLMRLLPFMRKTFKLLHYRIG